MSSTQTEKPIRIIIYPEWDCPIGDYESADLSHIREMMIEWCGKIENIPFKCKRAWFYEKV